MSALNLARFFAAHPLTRGNQLGAWARFASWQLRSRIQGEVIIPWIGGQRLAVVRGMTGSTGNIYVGLHEFSEMMFVLHFLRAKDLFLDIGANVGTYSVLASGVCRATTWAFEPDPLTAKSLRRNIEINQLRDLITVHEAALGAKEEMVGFTIGLDTVNTVLPAGTTGARMVEQKVLDAVVGSASPIMMKIDVEGYEDAVLQGGDHILAAPSLRAIEIETVSSATRKLLEAHGFELVYYDPYHRALKTEPMGWPASNSLFVKDRAFVAARLAAASPVHVLGATI
jgi:FkbM family methyltransferase